MKPKLKLIMTSTIILFALIGTYYILNKWIVLDRTDQTFATYDFFSTPADVEVIAEGTGKQNIIGDKVSTKLKILHIKWNKSTYNLVERGEIEANEYFVVLKNRQVSRLPFAPGRRITSMGTTYKRLKKGEQKTVHLKMNSEKSQLWIMPEEIIKQ